MLFRISVFLFAFPYLAATFAAETVRFNRDVRPILSENCFYCHGPDAGKREADLRLDDEASAKAVAIREGDANASELVARILSTDPETVMPPPSSGRQLSAVQIETLKHWIDQGASFESHWSLIPAVRHPVPPDKTGWSRNEIDGFIIDGMQPHGLSPAPDADRETWLRRVTFDLTGLPPTLPEINDFLADLSPSAFETVVERLLASPRFGERMTADWLDVARYSDSYGMQVDKDRRVWPYRDWVIQAFNRGIGYDQFITEQIAGDLLPDATRDQVLATAFNRLHPQECEGGSVPEEFRMESVADRTQTVATAILGLTMECCRCHDHKYDPLSQKDYYSLSAFFDNIDEAGLYSYFTDACPTPALMLPSEEQIVALEKANQKQLTAIQKRDAINLDDPFEAWLGTQTVIRPLPTREPVTKQDFEAPVGGEIEIVPGKVGNAGRFNGDDGLTLNAGNFDRWQPFTVALWMQTPNIKERAVVFHRSRAWTDAASRGYELLIDDGHLQASLIHFWPGNAVSVRTVDPLAVKQWVHVAVVWDGSSAASGLSIFIDGKPAKTEVVRDALTKTITGGGGDEIMIGARFRDRGFAGGDVDDFKAFDRNLSALEISCLHDPGFGIDTASATGETSRALLKEYYASVVNADAIAAAAELTAARREHFAILDAVPEIMAMKEMAQRRQSYLLARGAYDARKEPVSADTPSSLPEFDVHLPRNRLGLASWMTGRSNPLVARVAVNRFWQTIFGRGLVGTPEDFGSQGMPPSHPELLDWLAVDFMESDWDIKRLLRNLVLSSTYRQSSFPIDPRDPENTFLARSPRYRLPAEMLRDNVLALSGLLDSTIGGEPARPYEVEVSFKPVPRDQGRGLYRRSLYTYWKRTGPAPMLTTLDASLRDVCRVKRDVTASPLQALVMFNSPQFVEASRVLAQSLVRDHESHERAIVHDLFRLLTSREPTDEETVLLVGLLERQHERFAEAPEKANELLSIGDTKGDPTVDRAMVAATTSLVISLLNFDQSITKY